ncbi:hypothetical protein [Bradyrhizobium algeriense]|uniref:hypothetical protein n=1 Tax=Bradyrhizobium algeriense TaxID=634784 RepID=UPI000D3430DB|nr:hypothetical protein [Bradyrhizobium algeriense]
MTEQSMFCELGREFAAGALILRQVRLNRKIQSDKRRIRSKHDCFAICLGTVSTAQLYHPGRLRRKV